jgi:chromate transporter
MEAAAERKPEGIKLKIEEARGSSKEKAEPLSRKGRRLLPLYLSMAKIGLIGFGGGSALIPVIEREVVEDQQLVTEDDYNKVVVEACVTPGALPVEIAAGLGHRAGGIKGMLAAALLMAVPGVLITVVILSLLSNASAGVMRQIQCLSIGLGAFISCLLILYAVNSLQMARAAGKRRFCRAAVIMAGVFVLNSGSTLFHLLGIDAEPFFGLSTVQVLALAFFGILYTNCRFNKKNAAVAAAVSAVYVLCVGNNGLLAFAPVKYAVWAVMGVLAVGGAARGIREDAARRGGIGAYQPETSAQTAAGMGGFYPFAVGACAVDYFGIGTVSDSRAGFFRYVFRRGRRVSYGG